MQAFVLTAHLIGRSAKDDTAVQRVIRPASNADPNAYETISEKLHARILATFGLPKETCVAYLVHDEEGQDTAECGLSDIVQGVFQVADTDNGSPPFGGWDQRKAHLKVQAIVRKPVKAAKRSRASSLSIGSGPSQQSSDVDDARWHATGKDAADQYWPACKVSGVKTLASSKFFWKVTKPAVLAKIFSVHEDLIGRVGHAKAWSYLTKHVSNVNMRVAATHDFLREKAKAAQGPAGNDATDSNTSSCAEEAGSIKPNSNRKLAGGHSAGVSLADLQKYKAAAQVFLETYSHHVKDGTVPSDIKDLVERAMNAFSAAGVDYGTAFDGIEVDKNGQQGLLADENSKISSPDRAGLSMDGIRPQRLLLENGHAGSGSGDMGELVPELLADNGATTSAAEQHTLADDSDEDYDKKVADMDRKLAAQAAEAIAAKRAATMEKTAKRKRDKQELEKALAESLIVKQKEAENAAMMEEMAAMKAKMKELEQKHAKEAKKRQCVDAARPPLTEIKHSSSGRSIKPPPDKDFSATPVKK